MEKFEENLPKWLQEFKRFLPLKSQFFIHGNINDCYFFPDNKIEENNELTWIRIPDVKDLIQTFLEREGYELIVYYDVVDGFTVNSIDKEINEENLIDHLELSNCKIKKKLKSELSTIQVNVENSISLLRYLVRNKNKLSAGIFNYSSRLSSSPNSLDKNERIDFLLMLKAAQESIKFHDRGRRNILIFICDKLNDIPSWVLLENPLTKGIYIPKPTKDERKSFLMIQSQRTNATQKFYFNNGENFDDKLISKFSDLTDSLTNQELENLVTISHQEKIDFSEIDKVIDLFKYGTKENFWEKLEKQKIDEAEVQLRKRVIGQEKGIQKSVEIIKRAKLGLFDIDQNKSKNKPKGVLFFAGPTGVGKTELAKSLAELIFNDEDAIIRFDMSEYNDSNSDVKLIGAPPGYVGYDEGGQLTSKIKEKPFSVILFDEIEKAHPKVFDKFLQILDDGRLTDGKGETVYFSESLIIFTSNLGMKRKDADGNVSDNVTIKDSYPIMEEKILGEIKHFFSGTLKRPEIYNRFGKNFIVFDFIRKENDTDKLILQKILNTIKINLKERKNCIYDFDEKFISKFREVFIYDCLELGGRGIKNEVEDKIINGITNFLFRLDKSTDLSFKSEVDEVNKVIKFKCF
jgi:ATP-dependent Clp protease ATP-binding subunit ClpA